VAPQGAMREAETVPLVVKVRDRGHSVSVVIPAQIARAMDLGKGTSLQVEIVGVDMLTLRRVKAAAAPTPGPSPR
jgi:antitoxin component of MazEF toxin-antitoxin module